MSFQSLTIREAAPNIFRRPTLCISPDDSLVHAATFLATGPQIYAEIAKARGVKAETMLARGHPAKAILDAAKTKGTDLIVVGSRGLGGVKGLFLGSVSNAVVQNSKVPVMVIK